MKQIRPPKLGISILLVIFTVLILGSLAMLSLSQSLSQQRLSEAAARSVKEYYEADLQAQEIFSRLRLGELPPQVSVSENQYCYVCPISRTRALQVILSREEEGWKILRWQETVCPEEISEGLEVWNGTGGTP